MGYVPPRELLGGMPAYRAECYGKPHYLCSYVGRRVNETRLFDGARCACCGRPATNAHHWPPKAHPSLLLHGQALRPALFAVCGTGTTGCHGGWHSGGRFKALWRWEADYLAKEWWEGGMLDETGPHANELYLYGWWELYDLHEGRIWKVRL